MKDGSPTVTVDGSGLRVALVAASWHRTVMDGLIDGARRGLADAGVTISTRNAGELAHALPRLSRQLDVRLREVRALDASLDSVFADLTSR